MFQMQSNYEKRLTAVQQQNLKLSEKISQTDAKLRKVSVAKINNDFTVQIKAEAASRTKAQSYARRPYKLKRQFTLKWQGTCASSTLDYF